MSGEVIPTCQFETLCINLEPEKKASFIFSQDDLKYKSVALPFSRIDSSLISSRFRVGLLKNSL